jgi:hypothetical protein
MVSSFMDITDEKSEELLKISNTFEPIHFNNWQLDIEPKEFLVDRLIEKSSIIIFYGPPKSMKSLLMVDLMVSLVEFKSWCGRKIPMPANVLYAAFEDIKELKLRTICSNEYKLTEKAERYYNNQCGIAGPPPNIFEPSFAEALGHLCYIDSTIRSEGEPPYSPRVLIIDTLALAMSGVGDENSSAAMGKVIDTLRRIRDFGITVIIVHHSGKDVSKGLRGHNSLEAAADSVYSVTKKPTSDFVKIKHELQRNGPVGEVFLFERKTGVLKIKKDIEEKEVLVSYLDYIENSSETEKENTLTKPQILVLNSLQRLLKTDPTNVGAMFGLAEDHLAVSYSLLAEDCKHQNMAPNGKSLASVTKAIKRAIEGLVESSLVAEKNGFIWPTPLEQTDPDNTENS